MLRRTLSIALLLLTYACGDRDPGPRSERVVPNESTARGQTPSPADEKARIIADTEAIIAEHDARKAEVERLTRVLEAAKSEEERAAISQQLESARAAFELARAKMPGVFEALRPDAQASDD